MGLTVSANNCLFYIFWLKYNYICLVGVGYFEIEAVLLPVLSLLSLSGIVNLILVIKE
jgi:hypothetical protein